MQKTVVVLELKRETKGAVLYQEIDSVTGEVRQFGDPKLTIGTLYIRKSAMNGQIPVKLEVEITSI